MSQFDGKPVYRLIISHQTASGKQYAIGQLLWCHIWNHDGMNMNGRPSDEMVARVSPYNRKLSGPHNAIFDIPTRKLEKA